MRRPKITKREKRLIGAVAGSLALILSGALYRYYIEIAPVLTFPKTTLPSPNAFDFYVRAANMHAALLRTTPKANVIDLYADRRARINLTLQQAAQRYPTAAKEAWVRKNAATLRLIRQGFKYRCYQPPDAFDAQDYSSQFRPLVYLLFIESRAKSERGDWTGASRSALDILHFGHDLPRGGPALAAFVGIFANAVGCSTLRDVLPHLDAAAARNAASQIEKLESSRVTYAEILQEEKKAGQRFLQEIMKVGWRANILRYYTDNPSKVLSLKNRIRLEMGSKRYFMNSYTRCVDDLITEAKKPYTSRQPVPFPDNPVNAVLAPLYSRLGFGTVRDETTNKLLEVDLALRAFRLEHRVFPKAVQELVPSYFKKIPRDPFGSGGTLRYRRTAQSYLLYSVGPDGKDDGGKAIDDPSRAKSSIPDARYFVQPDRKGDCVAGINR